MIPTIKYAKNYFDGEYLTSIDEAILALKHSMVEQGACHGVFEPGDGTRYEFSMLTTRTGIVVCSMMPVPTCAVCHHGSSLRHWDWQTAMNENTKRFMSEIHNLVLFPDAPPEFDFEVGRAVFDRKEIQEKFEGEVHVFPKKDANDD